MRRLARLDPPPGPAELEPKVAALRRWCPEIGRDPADINGPGWDVDRGSAWLAWRDEHNRRRVAA